MSSNRRFNLRKNKKNNDGNQSISSFVEKRPQRGGSGDTVEIVVDEDDAKNLSDQYEFKDETVSRPLRRRKKHIVIEEENEEKEEADEWQDELDDMDEVEKEQMKEALRQSRLQMEQDVKRREIYKIFQNNNFGAGVEIPSTSGATSDLASSPVSSGTDVSRQQRAESPELFGTPQPSSEQTRPSAENPNDSASNKARSPFKTDISIKISPIKTYTLKTSDDSPKTTKEYHKEKSGIYSTETNDDNIKRPHNLKKRKHVIDESDDDDFDCAKENVKEVKCERVESTKKQKTLDEGFVNRTRSEKKEKGRESMKEQFVIFDDESQDTSESEKRPNSVKKHKKSYKVTLQRKYKKPALAIKTIKDAMKARLFFSPPGIDHKLYRHAIVQLLDHSKKCIMKAQQICTKFVKWGLPIVAGPREGDTLDAKKDRRGHVIKESHNTTCTSPELKTRRGLRSTVSKNTNNDTTTRNESKQKETSVKVKNEKDSKPPDDFKLKTKNVGYIDSDEELTKPAFDYIQDNTDNWDEYNSKSKTFTFGENIDTSSTVHFEQDVKNNTEHEVSKGSKDEKIGKQYAGSISKDQVKDNEQTSKENYDNTTKLSKSSVQKVKNNENTNSDFQNTTNTNRRVDEKDSYVDEAYKIDKTDTANESIQTSKAGNLKTRNISESVSEQHPMNENNVSPKKYLRKDNIPSRTQNLNLSKETKTTGTSARNLTETKTTSNADSDSDTIDSSFGIGKAKRRHLFHKAPVVTEQEEEGTDIYGGEDEDADIELVDINDSTPTESNITKPGEYLTNATNKSGFLKVKRCEPKGQKQTMSEASHRAAEPAEKRMNKGTIASDSNPINSNWPTNKNEVECPICYANFPLKDIQMHAATCNGTPPESNQTDHISRRGMSNQPQNLLGDPSPQSSQEYGLRNLQVVVTKSPIAERKLAEQNNSASFKARRNLSLTKKGKIDEKCEKRTADVVDMTTDDDGDDDDDDIIMAQVNGSQSRDSSQGPNATWLASESQEIRKKEKFKVTYGGKKTIDTRRNPFSTLDFIPLENKQPSSDSDSEVGLTKVYSKKEVKTTPITSLVKGNTSCDDPIDIDSASDSDNEMFSGYKGKNPSKHKTRNINDVLAPKVQEFVSKKKKQNKKPTDDFDADDLANERALMELAGMSENSPSPERVPLRKRPSSDRINQSKSSKRRRKRATISSDDSDEDCQLCFVCDQRISKDIYTKHTEECIANRNACDNYATNSFERNNQPTGRPSSSNTIEMDSDEIGDSPIKTFKLIGDEDSSTVDFDNQFSFFNNKTATRGTQGRGRGRGKSRYKKKWRKKKKGG